MPCFNIISLTTRASFSAPKYTLYRFLSVFFSSIKMYDNKHDKKRNIYIPMPYGNGVFD